MNKNKEIVYSVSFDIYDSEHYNEKGDGLGYVADYYLEEFFDKLKKKNIFPLCDCDSIKNFKVTKKRR